MSYKRTPIKLKERVETRFKPGVQTDPATTMGAMVSKVAQKRILGYIDIAKELNSSRAEMCLQQ